MAANFHKDPWLWVCRRRGSKFTVLLARGREIPWRTMVFALTFLAFQASLEHFLVQVGASYASPSTM